MIRIDTQWTNSVFKKAGHFSCRSYFRLLESLPESAFDENNLVSKDVFMKRLADSIQSIEFTGEVLKEAREMNAPGSIGEHWFPGEGKSLRYEYIQDRKKLLQQLQLINILFRKPAPSKRAKRSSTAYRKYL